VAAMDRATGIHGMELLSGRTNLRSHTSGDVDRDDSIRVGVRLRLHAEDVGPQLMPRHVRHRLNRKNVVGGDRPAACSPLRNQSRVNLEQARKLMADSSNSINAIATATGFADASHLIAWFRKQYGETPSSFRKRRREVEKRVKE